jgi:hypothetical protein
MAAPIAECIKLLDITKTKFGLSCHECPQADFERAMMERVKRSRWQCVHIAIAARDKNLRRAALHRNDGRCKPDLDRGFWVS